MNDTLQHVAGPAAGVALDPLAGTLAPAPRAPGGKPESPCMFHDEPFPPLGGPAAGTSPAAGVPPDVPALNGSILALDLANRCGWAVRRRDGRLAHGVENFTPRDGWTSGQRWQRFRAWLANVIVQHQVTAIAFEVVIQGGSLRGGGHKSGTAGDAYGGFKALVELAADSHRLELHTVHVATVKKHWTGDGRADKAAMVSQASVRGFRVKDDNEADALAILHWAIAKETGAWKPAPKKPKGKTGGKGMRRPPLEVNKTAPRGQKPLWEKAA